MSERKKIVLLLSNQNYLRNWVAAGAFDRLRELYDVTFVVAKEDYWDPEEVRSFGIDEYLVVTQANYRKFFLRRLLTVTMFKHARKSKAFRIKMKLVGNKWAPVYKFLALPVVYQAFLGAIRATMPAWPEFSAIIARHNPAAVIAPSIAADNFTIDMTYTARKLGVKSMILINSWDNLVSKGVLPMPPDCVGVWGEQGVNQATWVQCVPRERVVALGVARFDRYFRADAPPPKFDLHEFNGIPRDKKIILYAATSIPFDDISALEILDRHISETPGLEDVVILFRPHPEMHKRAEERAFEDCDFKHVVLDRQVAAYYQSRFAPAGNDRSFLNNAELDYYPVLLKTVHAVVCPPTTLGVEGAMNGAPCLMICYGDGKNTWLSPEKMCQYESVEEVLEMPGVVPCRAESDLVGCFQETLRLAADPAARDRLAEATRYVVYRDEQPFAERLGNLVGSLVRGDKLSIEASPEVAK